MPTIKAGKSGKFRSCVLYAPFVATRSIRFTALSRFETNIYQRVFLRGRTYANKAVTDRQTKFVNKHFITVLLRMSCCRMGHDALLNLHDQNIILASS